MNWRLMSLILLAWMLPQAVLAQQTSVGISATVINTDFSRSWASFQSQPNGTYLVTIHAENSGNLASKDALLSLVLTSGWSYVGTVGDAGMVQTGERPYGANVNWRLAPIEGQTAIDIQATLRWPNDSPKTPLFISLSSAYSVPVYVQIDTEVKNNDKNSLWSSWMRSAGTYVSLTLSEFWYRLTTGIRLSLGNS